MTTISLCEMVVSASSGVVALGRDQTSVVAALGNPTDRSNTKPLILRYGPVQLTFRDGLLVLVAWYLDGRFDPRFDATFPGTLDAVRDWLADRNLEVSRDELLSYDDRVALRCGATTLLFEDGKLASVQLGTSA